MAELVDMAISTNRHLLVQAGTGVGKSLAYLAPVVETAQTAVVVTATKALQDQLARNDLPFIAEQRGELEHAVLKGRANYLCVQRGDEVAAQLTPDPEAARLSVWGAVHATGDRAELDVEPSEDAWRQVSVTPDECPGAARCPAGDRCHAEAARRRAEQAEVIVVNAHLYAVHLAAGGGILPDHAIVVIDEAHAFEEVVSSAMGSDLSVGRFTAVARTARAAVADAGDATGRLDGAGSRLVDDLGDRLGERIATDDEMLAGWLDLAVGRAEQVAAILARLPSSGPTEALGRAQRAVRAVDALLIDLRAVGAATPDDVVWVDGRAQDPHLRMAPIDVADRLRAVWGDTTVVATSATMPPALGRRLGLDDAVEEAVESPFQYRDNAMLYVAKHLPDPRHADWKDAVHDELEHLIGAAGGRTLALFTSHRSMGDAAEALRDRLPGPLLTQGDLPKPALIERFTADESASLFATMGFWQGIDVPGPTLSLVTIDRLPFARPDDPLLSARRERAGPAAFNLIDVPRAATLLAQGVGRLIRTTSDRGVVAVLDRRLASMGYRRDLLSPVPPLRRSIDRDEVTELLRSLAEAR
jgi:ATP-dependent DNA helicase DinG